MFINNLKQKLLANNVGWGVMVTFPSTEIIEMIGALKFDWVLLDNEHGNITLDTAENCIRACEVNGVTPIIRPATSNPETLSGFLDRGVHGLQVPHVTTKEEAEKIVTATKYHPDGNRGLFFRSRANNYGFNPSNDQYFLEANRESMIIAMIEDLEGINNITEIASTEGIDAIFLGSGDLSQNLGFPGQQDHPQVLELLDQAIPQVLRQNKFVGVSCPEYLIPRFVKKGVQIFHSSVQQLMLAGGKAYFKQAKETGH